MRGKSYLVFAAAAGLLLAAPGVSWAATSVGTNVSVDGTLTVNGNSTVGNATSSDVLFVNSRIAGSLIPTFNDSISLGEFARAYTNVFSSGTIYGANLDLDGNTTLGNVTSSDVVYINSRLGGSLIPRANNSLSLGEGGLAFGNVFSSGTLYVSTTQAGDFGGPRAPVFSFSNDPDTGLYNRDGSRLGVTIDGVAKLQVSNTDFSPFRNNRLDLGQFSSSTEGPGAWKNVFASGTMYTDELISGVTSTITMTSSSIIGSSGTALTFTIRGTASGAGSNIIIQAGEAGVSGAGGSINLVPGSGVGGSPGLVNIYTSGSGKTLSGRLGSAVQDDFTIYGGTTVNKISFGQYSGSEETSFRVKIIDSPANFPEVTGALTGSNPNIAATGTDDNINLDLVAKGSGVIAASSGLYVPDGKYLQAADNNAGAPAAGDCDEAGEIGRISIDTTGNALYVCNGATRGWDTIALTN